MNACEPIPAASAFDPRDATLCAVLERRAREAGGKVFVTYVPDGSTLTYAQIERLTRRVGNGIVAAGVARGAHVAVMTENCPEQLLALWGIARAAMVCVPINPAARGQLLAYFLGHSDCTALVVEEALLPRVAEVASKLPLLRRVFVVRVASRPAGGEGAAAQAGFPEAVEVRDFDALLETADAAPPTPPRFSDLAMLMFTSGTTGPSKMIMFAHAQVVYWGMDVALHHEYVPEDVAYVCLPLFHGNALLGSTMGSLMAGSSIALAHRFSAGRFWDEVRASGATVFNGVGAVTSFLWSRPPSPADREHRVNRCHIVPVPSFGKAFEERFGMKIMSAFGLTDYCLGAAYNTKSRRDKMGSAGLPRRNVEVRVVDEDDLDLPPGTPGEILLRSNNPWGASLGYYKAPEATVASRRNLWFHTGDRGYVDADGYVWYTDRIKDSIRRRGENISAFEVEEVVRAHPAVLDAAVYPVRAQATEDEVAVSLVLREGAHLDPAELVRHCGRNLAYFMVPRYVEVLDALPLTLSMKVEKYKLRARAEQDLGALWDRERAGIRVER